MLVEIEKMVYGGRGLARSGEGVVFVEDVLPGEQAEVEIVTRKKDYAFARPVRILKTAAARREPPCPLAAECGGCSWQHIEYEEQLRLKRKILEECFSRLAPLPPLDVFASPEFRYRCRVRYQRPAPGGKVGFFKKNSHTIITVPDCPILLPALNDFTRAHTGELAALSPRQTEVRALCNARGAVCTKPGLDRQAVSHLTMTVGNKYFEIGAADFFQANILLHETMANWVANHAWGARQTAGGEHGGLDGKHPQGAKSAAGGLLLDLYGGVGFFSVLLADSFTSGILVEADKQAAARASRNFTLNRMQRFAPVRATVERFLASGTREAQNADCIILDPPRAGLTPQVRARLADLAPRRLVYISCNPSTQARDIDFLVKKGGYTWERLVLFDCYPQTPHIETGVVLGRSAERPASRGRAAEAAEVSPETAVSMSPEKKS
jgi:23S rRNA (uracil1939-C5)-methyltransferase